VCSAWDLHRVRTGHKGVWDALLRKRNGTTLWTSPKTMTSPKIIPKARRYGDDHGLELLLVTSRNCGALLT